MQRLIAVEGYGQIRMGSTFGNLPGIRVDAAGQVYGQNKGAALVQIAYQSAGSKTGRPQFTMKPGAVEGIHNGIKALGFQYRTVGADVHRKGMQTLKIADGVSSFRFALGQKNGHIPTIFCRGAGNHEPIAAVVALSADHFICKPTFGSTLLAEKLKTAAGTDTPEIELVGLCTGICVLSNAILCKATFPESDVSVDAACCACVTPQSHDTALSAMKLCQIEINNEGGEPWRE